MDKNIKTKRKLNCNIHKAYIFEPFINRKFQPLSIGNKAIKAFFK